MVSTKELGVSEMGTPEIIRGVFLTVLSGASSNPANDIDKIKSATAQIDGALDSVLGIAQEDFGRLSRAAGITTACYGIRELQGTELVVPRATMFRRNTEEPPSLLLQRKLITRVNGGLNVAGLDFESQPTGADRTTLDLDVRRQRQARCVVNAVEQIGNAGIDTEQFFHPQEIALGRGEAMQSYAVRPPYMADPALLTTELRHEFFKQGLIPHVAGARELASEQDLGIGDLLIAIARDPSAAEQVAALQREIAGKYSDVIGSSAYSPAKPHEPGKGQVR